MHAQSVAYQERVERLYYSAARPREACAAAKGWLLDHFAGDDTAEGAIVRHDIELLAGVSLIPPIQRLYQGGWMQLLRDTSNVKGV